MAIEQTKPNDRTVTVLLFRATLWVLLIAPLCGALAGTIVAGLAFRSVGMDFRLFLDHGGPLGAVLGMGYGLVATPFIVNRSLWKAAAILTLGTVLGGLFPAIAQHVPFALFGSMAGGFTALLLLISFRLSETTDETGHVDT